MMAWQDSLYIGPKIADASESLRLPDITLGGVCGLLREPAKPLVI
jgi:hypothetical protein